MNRKFSPLDLLDMGDRDQDILRCLHREPGLTASEIAAKIDAQEEEVISTLKEMMERSQIVEQLENGKRVFSVRFSPQKPRTLHLPTDLLHMLEEGPEMFLAEAPLTSLLTPDEREALLAKSVTRHLMANEVMTWQGDQFKELGLVRMGLLRRSRLQKDQRKQAVGYVRRTEWFGLSEVLSQYSSLDTYTAVTESELLVWPEKVFLDFLKENNRLSMAINRLLSQQVYQYQNQLVYGDGRFWAIESVEKGAGATTLAVNLALLVVKTEKDPRVLLWCANGDSRAMLRMLGMSAQAGMSALPGQSNIVEHHSGINILMRAEDGQYPPQVQSDMLLTELKSRYNYIICDTGSDPNNELLLRLRGQANQLITITRDPNKTEAGQQRWNKVQPYARPAQKRILALNQVDGPAEHIDLTFNIVLPHDRESAEQARTSDQPIIEISESPLAQAYREIHHRLSLNHVVGIFIPSTLDVDQAVDNKEQVDSALSFLGSIFGGATKTEAEGVWQSETDGLVAEQVTIVRTFTSKQNLDQHLDQVIGFASQLKREMRQEAIAIDVDNQLMLV